MIIIVPLNDYYNSTFMINIVLSKTTIFVICHKNEINHSSVFKDFSRISFTTIIIAVYWMFNGVPLYVIIAVYEIINKNWLNALHNSSFKTILIAILVRYGLIIISILLLVKRSCTLPAKTTAICLQLMAVVFIPPNVQIYIQTIKKKIQKCYSMSPFHRIEIFS